MSVPLQEIIDRLNAHWPFSWAVAGDRVGLMAGHPQSPVDTVLVLGHHARRIAGQGPADGGPLIGQDPEAREVDTPPAARDLAD